MAIITSSSIALIAYSTNKIQQKENSPSTKNENVYKGGEVLAVTSEALKGFFKVNVPSFFNDSLTLEKGTLTIEGDATFKGDVLIEDSTLNLINSSLNLGDEEITAGNIIYSLAEGDGIDIAGGQNATISNTGVLSLQGNTGTVVFEAGAGITIDGLKITNSLPDANQNVFKTIKVGSDTFSAGSVTDTLEFISGTGITISSDTSGKKLTIAGVTAASTGWDLTGSIVSLTDSSYSVGIGTTAPAAKLEISGRVTGKALTILNETGDQDIFTASTSGVTKFRIGNDGNIILDGAIHFTNSTNAILGTQITSGWTFNSNTFDYRRIITVTNNDGSATLPSGHQVTIELTGADASDICSNTRTDNNDIRIGYNSTEIARNITRSCNTSVSISFQLEASISPSSASSVYYIYYGDASLETAGSTYTYDSIQLDSADAITGWASSDDANTPISVDAAIKNEGTGSIKITTAGSAIADTGTGADGVFDASVCTGTGLNLVSTTCTVATDTKSTFNFTTITIPTSYTVTATGDTPIVFKATGAVSIAGTGTIDLDGGNSTVFTGGTGIAGGGDGGNGRAAVAGSPQPGIVGSGTGGGGVGGANGGGGGGGGHGGAGGEGGGATIPAGGSSYDTDPSGGSGGGGGAGGFNNGGSGGGGGGGGISIQSASTITIESSASITANGGDTVSSLCGAGGGGSGGRIQLYSATSISLSGNLNANGGDGSTGSCSDGQTYHGGGGGGGRIFMYDDDGTVSGGTRTVTLGTKGGNDAADGSAGVVTVTTLPLPSQNDTITKTITSTDLSEKGSITFWARSDTTGQIVTLGFGEAAYTEQTTPITISSADTWEQKTFDISGVSGANKDAVTKIGFTIDGTASFSFWFDDIQANPSAYGGSSPTLTSSGATLGESHINLNAQGTGVVRFNYDGTNSQAGSGGLKLYDGATTQLFAIDGSGNIVAAGTLTGLTGLTSSGTITFSTFSSNGGPLYTNGSGVLAQITAGTTDQCLKGGTSPSFGSCGGGSGAFQELTGSIVPNNSTLDFLIGGQATTSAKFAVLNVNSGTPVASISAISPTTALSLSSDGSIQTVRNNTLTLGGDTTGDITLSPLNGNGTVDIAGDLNLASSKEYFINDILVLNATTLGSGVLTSSLTTVGALASGSIANGFGTIVTSNTITGTTLNGTTGINTGASAGTQRIDSSGNLVNINNITAGGAITFSTFSSNGGLLYTNDSGVLAQTAIGSNGDCLQSIGGGTPTWGSCGGGGGAAGAFQELAGAIVPNNSTLDFLVGGQATTSARFAILGVNDDTPSASVSAIGSGKGLSINYDGSIQTTNNNTLTIGGGTTGEIVIQPNADTEDYFKFTSDATNLTLSTTDSSNLLINPAGILQFQSSSNTIDSSGNLAIAGSFTLASDVVLSRGDTNRLDLADGDGFRIIGGLLELDLDDTGATQGIAFGSTGDVNLYWGGSDTLRTDDAFNVNGNFNITSAGAISAATGIVSSGGITFSTFSSNGGLLYTNDSGVLAQTAIGSNGECLQSIGGGTPTWGSCGGGGGAAGAFQELSGVIAPNNSTLDFLIGGTATTSAKFAILNVDSGTPVASISANSGNVATYITGDGTFATTDYNKLILGGTDTGDIELISKGNLLFHSRGLTSISGGISAGENLTSGDANTFFGEEAGKTATTQTSNSYFGYRTGYQSTGTYNSIFGANAGIANGAGAQNSIFGASAGRALQSGGSNSFFGNQAGRYTTNTTSSTFIGAFSGYANTNGVSNVFLGYYSGSSNTQGANNLFLGYKAGDTGTVGNANNTGSNNTFIGYQAGPGTTTQLTNAGALGYEAHVSQDYSLVLGGTGANAIIVGIGTETPTAVLDIQGGQKGGNAALIINQTGASGNDILSASASGDTKFTIANNGNVGIGIDAPAFKLDLTDSQDSTASALLANSSTNADADVLLLKVGATSAGTSNRFVTFLNGNGEIIGNIQGNGSGGVTYSTTGIDFAEYYKKENRDEFMEAGDILCLGTSGGVQKCHEGNEAIIGVVSDRAGFVGGSEHQEDPNYVLVGVVGQLLVKVDGNIRASDPLTTSSIPGTAKKATSENFIIGRALEGNIDNNNEKVMISISTGYYAPILAINDSGNISSANNAEGSFPIDQSIPSVPPSTSTSTKEYDEIIERLSNQTVAIASLADQVASTTARLKILEEKMDNINLEDIYNLTPFATESADFVTINQGLLVLGTTSVGSISINDRLAVGNSFFIENNAINTLGDKTLEIQPLKQADISFMAGLVIIDTEGRVQIENDLDVYGDIRARSLSGIDGPLAISGSAQFEVLGIQRENATENNDKSVTINSSAGKLTLKANEKELTVNNSRVTEESLIFITSKNSTNKQVLFIKDQGKNYFTVAIEESLDEDIEFNFLIIN